MASRDDSGPEIDYPTAWDYRIVGTSEEAIRCHVQVLLGGVEYELILAKRSSGGKYVSMHLSLVVQDEAQRLAIFNHLAGHETIRFVV